MRRSTKTIIPMLPNLVILPQGYSMSQVIRLQHTVAGVGFQSPAALGPAETVTRWGAENVQAVDCVAHKDPEPLAIKYIMRGM